jgi:glycerophosphoryl diester phosphodiesterase
MKYRIHIPAELRDRQTGPFILAHRGCRARAPENSMAAFHLALEQGADIIETDLRITRDRVIVCMHDAAVDRTTDGTGRVDQLTWSDVKRLRVRGNNDSAYPEARVPALAEVLEAFADRTYLALELKSPAFTRPADVELLLGKLQDYSALDRVIAISFSRRVLRCAEMVGVPLPLAHIAVVMPWPSARYPMTGAWWPLLFLNPLYVAISHRRGQIFCPLDSSPEPRLPFYLRLGVDGLLSDDPLTTRQAVDKWKANLTENTSA